MLLIATGAVARAQERRPPEAPDTLKAAVKVDDRVSRVGADAYRLDPVRTRRISSPLGEGDAVKYIQTLPGVAMGGEGGSAFYVRGGNMGSNLMTLDGVPVYGVSHLLGFTTIFPQDAVDETVFQTGGFPSDEGNFTASHIKLISRDGDYRSTGAMVSANPFLLSCSLSTPIVKEKVSVFAVVRASPLGLEYRAAKPIINRFQSVLDDFGATVGDAFAKVSWRKDAHNDLSFSVFGSQDRYRFRLDEQSLDILGWSNLLAQFSWKSQGLGLTKTLNANLSYNRHVGNQEQESSFEGVYNQYRMRSTIDELTASAAATFLLGSHSELSTGAKIRWAAFNPGASSLMGGSQELPLVDNRMSTLLATLHGQWEFSLQDRFLLRLSMRGNAFSYGLGRTTNSGWLFNPEGSLLVRWNILRNMGLESTVDALTQYYHTLEGIPLGWSVDMIVPSDSTLPPEQALQEYFGLFGSFGNHNVRVGGFYKRLRNLVYYGQAADFFSMSQSGWRDNIKVGDGTAYGAELLYEKEGRILSWRVSYTWSKTDRTFIELNDGLPFPAKYDRRHIANITADWTFLERKGMSLSATTLFTYQSGSWDTLQDGYIPGWFIDKKDPVKLPMISSLHNYELPAYIRWDGGLHLEMTGGRIGHELNIGVYNILNRRNPFMLRYNTDTQEWNLVSLIPIMPNISYRIRF